MGVDLASKMWTGNWVKFGKTSGFQIQEGKGSPEDERVAARCAGDFFMCRQWPAK
jgi:hypothetical protein